MNDSKSTGKPHYVIGVDTYDNDALAYCFGRRVNGVFEIMLAKTMCDENKFKQEVENLAEYFKADVIKEVDDRSIPDNKTWASRAKRMAAYIHKPPSGSLTNDG